MEHRFYFVSVLSFLECHHLASFSKPSKVKYAFLRWPFKIHVMPFVCLLFTVSAGDVHASVPIPPCGIPGQPQVLVVDANQQLDPNGVGMDAVNNVMNFVTSTFGGARLMDSHSVSHLKVYCGNMVVPL